MKAMWSSPKVSGFNLTERWGHSACYCEGLVYVYGGCRGGLLFSDVLVLNLGTMAWSTFSTTGEEPGPRDSHSAVLIDRKMIVFGGTNGTQKVNDIHILDLETREWIQPQCKGTPPSPRESHTATLVGNERLLIFGGSGEGRASYLNDLHVLDLRSMKWSSPEVKGYLPVPRDSHIAVGIWNKLFIYGGDCGDQYEGGVDVFDTNSMAWSKLAIHGAAPAARAGHAAVNISTQIYVIGGVGDKRYYNDVWILDVSTCSWSHVDIGGHRPQGRFSHTAVGTFSDIAIYGGCGEDEHPLSELLILQLGPRQPNGDQNISCNKFRSNWSHEKWKFLRRAHSDMVERDLLMAKGLEAATNGHPEIHESRKRQLLQLYQDMSPENRRKTINNSNSKMLEVESEQEEHSLSLSQNSSPSQSDQDQIPVQKAKSSSLVINSTRSAHFNHLNQTAYNSKPNPASNNGKLSKIELLRTGQDVHFPETKHQPAEHEASLHYHMIGAEVRGKVDGSFDSGLLLTATVNGRIFKGVLFPAGPGVVSTRATTGFATHPTSAMENLRSSHQFTRRFVTESNPASQVISRPLSMIRVSHSTEEHDTRNHDLQGVVLTLAGPGSSESTRAGSNAINILH